MKRTMENAGFVGFSRYLLRTTDVEAANTFYEAVLGGRGDGILPLHESAIARGARPHWLGHVQVGDLGGAEEVAAQFVERGASHLGPPPGVADFVILRDPGGAIVAVTENTTESSAGVVWHVLNTRDPHRAAANYSSLFGWSFSEEELNLGPLGRHQRFAFRAGEAFIGLVSDIEGRPEVHPHWLFSFAVASLDVAVNLVRTLGGSVVGPIKLPNGARIAVCDDAQGAAFGLIETEDAVRLATG
jgi:predicted enzyme related to lactoylglutathione lyase